MAVLAVLYLSCSASEEGGSPTSGVVRIYKVHDDGSVVYHAMGTYPVDLSYDYVHPLGFNMQRNAYGYGSGVNDEYLAAVAPITPSTSDVDRGTGPPVVYVTGGATFDEQILYASEAAYLDNDPLFSFLMPFSDASCTVESNSRFRVAPMRGGGEPPAAFWTSLVGATETL